MNSLRRAAWMALAITLMPAAQAATSTPQTPPDLPGVTVVTAAQARDLMVKGVLIVDTRVASEYVEQRINGAVSIPYKEKAPRHRTSTAGLTVSTSVSCRATRAHR